MAVYKRYKGKKISSKHPAYAIARWWVYKRVKGYGTIHQGIPEARTREEAELAERQLLKQLFDKSYGITDTTTTFESFVESTYRKYVEQNNVNKVAKNGCFNLVSWRAVHGLKYSSRIPQVTSEWSSLLYSRRPK